MKRALPILLLATLLLIGCAGEDESGDGKLYVVCTTGQVADLAREVGGERVRVEALMGPGIDPHLYKASAGDVERLRRADLILYNGLHLEAKMGEVIEKMGAQRPTLAVAELVPEASLLAHDDYEDLYDPHVWFDLQLWALTPTSVAEELATLDAAHADDYRSRARDYAVRIESLHDYARERFATVPEGQRVLITAHDAFKYLGRAYGMDVRGLQGISTATEAGTGDVQSLAAFIVERRIPALFVETSVSPRAIQALREAVKSRGFEVRVGGEVYSDALGDEGTPQGTYLGMVRHNVDTISAALRGEGGHEGH